MLFSSSSLSGATVPPSASKESDGDFFSATVGFMAGEGGKGLKAMVPTQSDLLDQHAVPAADAQLQGACPGTPDQANGNGGMAAAVDGLHGVLAAVLVTPV